MAGRQFGGRVSRKDKVVPGIVQTNGGCRATSNQDGPQAACASSANATVFTHTKTDEEWRQQLSPGSKTSGPDRISARAAFTNSVRNIDILSSVNRFPARRIPPFPYRKHNFGSSSSLLTIRKLTRSAAH